MDKEEKGLFFMHLFYEFYMNGEFIMISLFATFITANHITIQIYKNSFAMVVRTLKEQESLWPILFSKINSFSVTKLPFAMKNPLEYEY